MMTSLLGSSFLCLFENRYYCCNKNQSLSNLGDHTMSWVNINERRVPVNDGRYKNRFNLCLEYSQIYGHAYSIDKEVVVARYNRLDDILV